MVADDDDDDDDGFYLRGREVSTCMHGLGCR
jgi:hypothetical protein